MATAELVSATQYLTFTLGTEVFAFDIGRVREVLDFTSATRVPRTPDFMVGVINLRGSVIPVVDLRLKFGMTRTERSVNTCVIITEVVVDNEPVMLGALADSVREVVDLDPGQIAAAPTIGTRFRSEFIRGMGKHHEGFIILLDVDWIFADDAAAMQPDGDAA